MWTWGFQTLVTIGAIAVIIPILLLPLVNRVSRRFGAFRLVPAFVTLTTVATACAVINFTLSRSRCAVSCDAGTGLDYLAFTLASAVLATVVNLIVVASGGDVDRTWVSALRWVAPLAVPAILLGVVDPLARRDLATRVRRVSISRCNRPAHAARRC